MTTAPLFKTLRDGSIVLAKLYKGDLHAMTFANRTQAENAAKRVGGWVQATYSRPFFVQVEKA